MSGACDRCDAAVSACIYPPSSWLSSIRSGASGCGERPSRPASSVLVWLSCFLIWPPGVSGSAVSADCCFSLLGVWKRDLL
jgi:hypothetical protein